MKVKLADIIPIRKDIPVSVTCFECEHGYIGVNGVMCEITRDLVFDEKTAASCEAFERA